VVTVVAGGSVRGMGGAFAALRVFSGVVWLSNGLAKVFLDPGSRVDWGFVEFELINQPTARSMLERASRDTWQPLRSIYHDFVLGNWGFFAWFLTVGELLAGVLLVLGVASRLGAVIPLLLIGPVWIMMLPKGLYLWEYPNELFPLLLLAIVPSGRVFGRDRTLAPRFGGRWPF
jgi:uncharacterized membrane protein YphA (DoxX/SURF4 family)